MILPPEVVREQIEKNFPFAGRMGLRVEELRPGFVRLRVPLEGNENHIGTMYAGALFTLAEIPAGALVYATFDADLYYPVIKEMTIRYVKAVTGAATFELSMTEGDIENIKKRADADGKADFDVIGVVMDDSGTPVAETNGRYQLRRV